MSRSLKTIVSACWKELNRIAGAKIYYLTKPELFGEQFIGLLSLPGSIEIAFSALKNKYFEAFV